MDENWPAFLNKLQTCAEKQIPAKVMMENEVSRYSPPVLDINAPDGNTDTQAMALLENVHWV